MIIYKINEQTGYFDGIMEILDDPENIFGIPYGTTKKSPPQLSANEYAVWNGSGWDITIISPPAPKSIILPIKTTAFYDRFGDVKYNIIFSTDPQVQNIVQQSRTYSYLDLNSPDLINYVEALFNMGFDFDINQVLNKYITEEELYHL